MRIGTGSFYIPPETPLPIIRVNIIHCTAGIYLRWWFNGWHYFNFQNGYDNFMQTEDMDVQVTRMFSRISKIEHPTKLKAGYSYLITLEGITAENIPGFTQMLLAERVEQYEDLVWREVDITRGEHLIKDEGTNGYVINFEITRKELPNTPAVYQKSIKFYIGEILCDLDDDEIIPVNKQVNDIAEMQDRQSDFTAQFKIRKTREMMALFERSGEVGASTTFPYENQTCRLIQNGIEMITGGITILDKVDDLYYYVSVLSGNKNFFKDIEKLKLTDLTLVTTVHDWNATDQEDSQDNDRDFLYPLCEPSDDGAIGRKFANLIEMYGGWIWPFVKVKVIWDEIFKNAGYWDIGNILTADRFLKLWMPISSLKITNTDNYLYSLWNQNYDCPGGVDLPGGTLIKGDFDFSTGHYIVPYTATYTFKVYVHSLAPLPALSLCESGFVVAAFTSVPLSAMESNYEVEYLAAPGDDLTVASTMAYFYYYSISIVKITDAKIGYGSLNITPRLHLPDMTQTDFIKMICNMFGLIPDVSPRDHIIHFWNYSELYDNIPISRDWSAYLSEREDETEFKFGDYAQNNYLRYKDSDDVIKDNGRGDMQIDDETLPVEKDVVELPVSTCDEVTVLTDVNISRIPFNKWDTDISLYVQNDSIDPRICFMKQASGAKTFAVWDDVPMVNNHFDANPPKIVCSLEVSFSDLVNNYQGLSRLLTKTNLRRAKFHLPVYEVAGLKHYIPIYLSQYKAYFYVNKINNYVPGKLCTIDLIKL
jgi:hypothetical protein